MRVGFIYLANCWNVLYRAVGVADALRARGADVHLAAQSEDGSLDSTPLQTCDVVHIYRRADRFVLTHVDDLRRRGVAITWDNDDDLRRLPPEGTRIGRFAAERDFAASVKMIRRADVVTTTNDLLAETFNTAGARRVRVIENYLLPFQIARPTPRRDGVRIGWVAAEEHIADARVLEIPALLRAAMDKHPELRVTTVGIGLGGLDPSRYQQHRLIPFQQLKDEVRTWDLGIAPLADIPMSYARSNVKVKEYAGAGVPWLASARGPYLGLGPDQGGVLVADDDWSRRLDLLISSTRLRQNLSDRAQRWGATQDLDGNVDQWIRTFNEAIALARRRTGASPMAARDRAPQAPPY